MSVAYTVAWGAWRAMATAIAPLPVPMSAISGRAPGPREEQKSIALSTRSSVSCLGISTAGLTSRSIP